MINKVVSPSVYKRIQKVVNKYKRLNKKVRFTDPELRYLTSENAREWIKIGKSTNTHTLSVENKLIKDNFTKLDLQLNKPVIIVDIGCGDGRKAVQLINDLSNLGFKINRYVAIDISKDLINHAIDLVSKDTELTKKDCISICSTFENLNKKLTLINKIRKQYQILHLFVGNTFNNFKKEKIIKILNKNVWVNEYLIVGLKVRLDSSLKEQQRIVKEYSSYGPNFTYSFGYLLGLAIQNMDRVVKYNPNKNRLEIYLKVRKASELMRKLKIGNYKLIHVFNSYKPLIKEIQDLLQKYFKIDTLIDCSKKEVVMFCKK